MNLALDAAAGQPEPTAWVHVELAKLELGLGRAALPVVTRWPVFESFPAIPVRASSLPGSKPRKAGSRLRLPTLGSLWMRCPPRRPSR
jgi:hypothetical protein